MVFHPPRPVALYVIWSVATALSVVCYGWLLCALRRNLAPIARERLFPRQLRSLAVSGMVMHGSSIPLILTRIGDLQDGSLFVELRCAMHLVLRVSTYWTIFQETHMVLTFFTQVMHWTTALTVLNRSIRAMWLLGILMTLIDPNAYTCSSKRPDFLVGALTLFCSTISVMSGFSMLYVILRGKLPGRANENFIRAAVYALIAPVSCSMMVGANFQPLLVHSPEWYFPMAAALKFSNGWMNTLAYALQSRYASRLLGRYDADCELPEGPDIHGDVRDFASLGVAFGGVDIQDVLPWTRSSSKLGSGVPSLTASERVRSNSSCGTNGPSKAPVPVVLFEDLY